MIVTIQQPLSREVFWHIYAKIPRHTSKNAITEGDFKCVFARNCEGTEQLRRLEITDCTTENKKESDSYRQKRLSGKQK